MSRPRLIGLGVGAVLFAVIIAVQALGTDGEGPHDDATTTPVAAATATNAPAASATTTPSTTPPLSGPIEGGFVRLDLAQGEVPELPYGIVFVDAETGAGEYWYVASANEEERGIHLGAYIVDPSHRWLQWHPANNANLYIADRLTGATYEVVEGQLRIILGPTPEGLVLLRSNPPDQSYTVVDLDSDPTGVEVAFELPSTEAIGTVPNNVTFLADGRSLLIGAYRVELPSGEVTELPPVLPPRYRETFATADGGWVLLTPHEDAEVGGLQIQRFDATGEPLDLVASPPVRLITNGGSLSPNASWSYTGAFLGLESPAMTNVWPAIIMIALQSDDAFRAIRVSPVFKRSTGAWLADSSGVVVATPDGFSILRTDGSLTPLPFGPVERSGVGGVPVPIPAPHDPNLFLYDGRILTAAGVAMSPEVAVAAWANLVPWNDYGFSPDGTELRFVQSPPPGRDYGLPVLTAFGLPARIEFPPFDDQLLLQVNSPDGLNLRVQPREDSEVISTLPDEAVVTVTDSPERMSSVWWEEADADPNTPWWVFDARWWVHVRTANGEQGWVRSEFVAWAE